jgi:glycosidase
MKRLFLSISTCFLCAFLSASTFFPSRTDFRDESIYFVITTRFFDGDTTNNVHCWDGNNPGDPAWRGDFKGLIEKMDYIKALGFTTIWMTPIVENASGYDYHGYHAHDFSKVDHRYESDGVGFQQVIDEAHKRGMKIILDIVLNHTGNFGEANLCKLFTRDWNADQSDIDACMIPFTQKDGGKLPDNYASLSGGEQYSARLSQMKNTTGVNYDIHNYWHHYGYGNWDDPTRWWMQIAGDCVDLNTEHPFVYNYLIACYSQFIKMGVDGFRIDTGGHIPRLTFNQAFVPAFLEAAQSAEALSKRGDTPFYMFAEVCARYTDIWYRGQPNLSPLYYTWAENKSYSWDHNPSSWDNIVALEGDACNTHTNHKSVQQSASDVSKPTSQNAFLDGNTYHTPDYSQASGLHVIDFTMHHNFRYISDAWRIAKPENDKYYNDATWNVVYVDSHDYAPNGAPEDKRFSGDERTLAENWSLMFTHRGIPCVYYGSEIQFKKGCVIDNGPNTSLINTGRAYYGGYIKGSAEVTDFAQFSHATGNMAQTLSHPLAQHVQRLNRIRQAVPALRKGQYSMSGCSGSYAFKRRYTDATTDSYALVTISGGATFSNIPNGMYVDCVTGDSQTVTNGTLSVSCSGKGNLRVYVLSTDKTPAPGKIGNDGKYIYASSSVGGSTPSWDGTEEELVNDPTNPQDPTEIQDPCLKSEDQRCAFFTKSSDFGNKIYCYMWFTDGSTTEICGKWPGMVATKLGNDTYRFDIPEDAPAINDKWMIIWNDGAGNQTADLKYYNQGMYSGANKGSIRYTSSVTLMCEDTPVEEVPAAPVSTTYKVIKDGRLWILYEGVWYDALGNRQE